MTSPWGGRHQTRSLLAAMLIVVAIGAACVPSNQGPTATLPTGKNGLGEPPPELGSDPTDTEIVRAIEFDLTRRSDDQNYWSFSNSEARCSAEALVSAVSAKRIASLGYRPGIDGAGITDIDLNDKERAGALEAITGCVDMKNAAAAIFFGAGRVSGTAATCLATILQDHGLVVQVFESWLFNEPIDPFANDGAMAETLAAGSQVCLDPQALNWPTLRPPQEDQGLIDSNVPPGSDRSAHPDDRRLQEEDGRDSRIGAENGGD